MIRSLALILLATVGMMFLVSAEDILMIFVSLELTSLSLYILTAFNKRDIKSAEAALKYFLFGGMSAAFMLFGLSLIYGLSGSTNLHAIAAALAGKGLDPLLVVAIVMTVIGFGFKVAAAPFHLWAPDAYEAAPIPAAAFIASGPKAPVPERSDVQSLRPPVPRGRAQMERIADLAVLLGRQWTPHTWTNGLGFLTNLHVALAFSTCPFVEMPFDPPGWGPDRRDWLLPEPIFAAEDGTIAPPDGPGLGIPTDLAWLESYRLA